MNCGGVRQVQRMVGQAPWSGPEENLFMTNCAVSSIFCCCFFGNCYFHIVFVSS